MWSTGGGDELLLSTSGKFEVRCLSGLSSIVVVSLNPNLFFNLGKTGRPCSWFAARAGAASAVVKGPRMDITASAAAHARVVVDVRMISCSYEIVNPS